MGSKNNGMGLKSGRIGVQVKHISRCKYCHDRKEKENENDCCDCQSDLRICALEFKASGLAKNATEVE